MTQTVTLDAHAEALFQDTEVCFEVSPEDFDRQCQLEEEMGALGAAAYWKEVDKAHDTGQLSSTRTGSFLLGQVLDKVVAGVLEWSEQVEEGIASARKPSAYKYIKASSPEVVAFIALRTVLDKLTREMSLTSMASAIGRSLEDEARLRQYRQELPAYYDAVKKSLDKRTSNVQRKRDALKGSLETKVEESFEDWPRKHVIAAGIVMVGIVIEKTGLITTKTKRARKRTTHMVVATPDATEILRTLDEKAALLSPVKLPTVIPPRPWTNTRSGGYWTPNVRMRLVKAFNKEYLSELDAVDMPVVYNAVNSLQVTPYRICKPVLEVMQTMYQQNRSDAGLPPSEDRYLPERPVDIDTNEEARLAWRREAASVHGFNARLRGKRIALVKTLWVADKFKDEPTIYFPKSLDFRGRIYDAPMYLQPQGHDTSKGLLEFAEGKPLGELGAWWLGVHIANCFGNDKVSLQDRVDWAVDNTYEIIAAADDPLSNRWWTEADKPWQFLQACFEWRGYCDTGDSFVSHIAVAVDGSCNGLQNLSAALLDPVGGEAVNLIPSDKPRDIYGIVAGKVNIQLERDASAGLPSAIGWKGHVTRTTCKRSVMTLPYGSKQFGFADQIRDDTLTPWRQAYEEGQPGVPAFPFSDDGYTAATYLAKLVWDATGETVVAAQKVMGWLQKSAREVAKAGQGVRWTTPAGLPVLQRYMKMNKTRLKTMLLGSSIRLNHRTPDDEKVDPIKTANSIAPNWVHSLDAAHMMVTIDIMNSISDEIPSYRMVHDSYGTHACDMPKMYYALRKAFVQIYSEDVLMGFYEELRSQVSEEVGEKLPTPPARGSLDLSLVMESDYFFA